MEKDEISEKPYYLNFWEDDKFEEFEPSFLGLINKINIFIGANNSRKSRMLRKIFCLNEFHFLSELEIQKIESIEEEIDKIDKLFKQNFKSNVLFEINDENNAFGKILNAGSPIYKFSDTDVFKYMLYISDEPGKIKVSDLKQVMSVLKNNLIKNEKKAPSSSISKKEIEDNYRVFAFSIIKDFIGELMDVDFYRTIKELGNIYYLDRIRHFKSEFIELFKDLMYFYDFEQDEHESKSFYSTYIPTLRCSLKGNQQASLLQNNYEELRDIVGIENKFLQDSNVKPLGELNKPFKSVITGTSLYSRILLRAKNDHIDKCFSILKGIFKSIYFSDKEISIVPYDDKGIEVKIGDDKYNIQDFGDGVQNLLMLIFPILIAENNSFILIDEPELSLHPGYQRLFMDTILNEPFIKEKKLTYFIATHSNHFLEFCERNPKEVSAFRFRYVSSKKSLIEPMNNSVEVLDEIGVCNNSVCMANCSIWVEGPTDVSYVRTFLHLYSKMKGIEFIEGLDYCFFEYGGNLIANYIKQPEEEEEEDVESENASLDMLRNANRILLIADQDIAIGENKPKKKERFQKLKTIENDNEANFQFLDTKYVEIENLLPKSCILSCFKKQMKINQKIEFPNLEIENIRLGKIFETLKTKYSKEGKANFANNNGSLKAYRKRILAKLVPKYYRENADITWEIITDEIKKDNPSHPLIKFVEDIYTFIEKHNLIEGSNG